MSLNANWEQVRDWRELHSDENESAKTDAIVWATLNTDMGKITEENADEFFARMELINTLDGVEPKITPEDVRRRIGLYTNVATLTRTAWLNKIKSALGRDLDRTVKALKSKREREQAHAPLADLDRSE